MKHYLELLICLAGIAAFILGMFALDAGNVLLLIGCMCLSAVAFWCLLLFAEEMNEDE